MGEGKVKASRNTAEQTETKPPKPLAPVPVAPPNQTIENMSSEQLALALNRAYQLLMGANQDIQQINRELEKRQKEKADGAGNQSV